jgi:hypothetical protein
LALGCAALARSADDPVEAQRRWLEAEAHRAEYVRQASAARTPDPWLSVARRRLGDARAETAAATKRLGKSPPRRTGAAL